MFFHIGSLASLETINEQPKSCTFYCKLVFWTHNSVRIVHRSTKVKHLANRDMLAYKGM